MRFRTKILLCMVGMLSLVLSISGTILIGTAFQTALNREMDAIVRDYRTAASAMEITAATADSDEALRERCGNTLAQLSPAMNWNSCRLERSRDLIFASGTSFSQPSVQPEPGECIVQILTLADRPALRLTAGLQSAVGRMRLTIGTDISHIYADREEMLQTFLWVFFLTLTVGGLLSSLLAAALTSPLAKVSRAAQQVAQGDLSVRVASSSQDEVGRFARDFNHMAAKLQENMTAMEETMAAQERFTGSFAHELKTPMTSIIGYADLLRGQSLDPKDAQEAANYIFTEARRLERLSLRLLQLHLAKHELPEMECVEVGELVQRLVQRLRPMYKKEGIRLMCKTKPGQWSLSRDLMESVLINLMDNARKAMEHGGSIVLFVDFPENTCRIRVVDNGRGMPSEAIDHLTDAFYRVDKSRSRAQGGAGLGLSLCKEILQWHNGALRFESAPGRGTCVSVILGGTQA